MNSLYLDFRLWAMVLLLASVVTLAGYITYTVVPIVTREVVRSVVDQVVPVVVETVTRN